jgi:hypothetical protein
VGIKQVRDGRRVGTKLNSRDVTSEYCRRRRNLSVESLDHYDPDKSQWRELLVEDRHAGPAETAACRIDFADWLRSLPRRSRRIAKTLATGETTGRVARRFRLSTDRIS